MGTGYIRVGTTTASGVVVVCDCDITITNGESFHHKSDCNGKTPLIALPTYNKERSLDRSRFHDQFTTVDVYCISLDYAPVEVKEVQIFDECTTLLNIALMPNVALPSMPQEDTLIVEGSLQELSSSEGDMDVADLLPSFDESGSTVDVKPSPPPRVFGLNVRMPVIPRLISVKLGQPGSNAEVVHVNFIDYIKNVASSEIFPTWPVEAIRANIYAIISLALNRVYTEWYRNQGYDFQITNTTALDQKYIHNREIFDTISVITDEIFNEYIRRRGFIEPLFAAFCDGRTAQCEGLKQWESVDLAEKGMNALEILRHFYGENIDIVESDQIQDVAETYPGRELKIGDSGNDVYRMERYLSRIALNYPAIPAVFPIYGIFDSQLELVVKKFQEVFNLPVTGRIGKDTWYKISFVYAGVLRVAELASEGFRLPDIKLIFEKELREGDRGEAVHTVQYYLNLIGQFVDTIPPVTIDGRFGPATKKAVQAFQKTYGLQPTGIVDRDTWLELTLLYEALINAIPARDELLLYTGTNLQEGDSGIEVLTLQYYLNNIGLIKQEIPKVPVDGFFGKATKQAIKQFQELNGLDASGVIDEPTWNAIVKTYSEIIAEDLYPGFDVQLWDHNAFVSVLQERINDIASANPAIPIIPVDGFYGIITRNAIAKFQEVYGLPVTGTINKTTWNKVMEVAHKVKAPMATPELMQAVDQMIGNQLFRGMQ